MPTSITTSNPNGIGYQTGLFSAPVGQPINRNFLDLAWAGRLNPNPQYREVYNCDIVADCGISQWLDQFADAETDCYTNWTTLETSSVRQQIRVAAPVSIPANPGTAVITLSNIDHFVGGAYVLPQVGNSLVLPPSGQMADITAVTHTAANTTTITVRLRPGTTGGVSLIAGDQPYVLSGSFIVDCACPTGQFAIEDLPLEQDVEMIHFGDKGEVCGDALDACEWFKIPFYDEAGNVVEEKWWNTALQRMYQRFEDRKRMEDLFNPSFGIIPTIKTRGLKFTPNSATEITIEDMRAWKAILDLNGVYCREFAIFAGTNIYSQWQRLADSAGVTRMAYERQPMQDCKWLNLDWCGITVEGLTFHIYQECSFSNGKALGGQSMIFPNSAIMVPMCNNRDTNRTTSTGRMTPRGGGYGNKMFKRVYFRSRANGDVFEALTDSDGILNGVGGKNSYGAGCRQHSWTIETRYANQLSCAGSWAYMGL